MVEEFVPARGDRIYSPAVDVSPTDEQRIVDQWQRAAPALARQRRDELRRLTPEEALASAAAVLEFLDLLPPLERGSGLVEQQRIFRRQR